MKIKYKEDNNTIDFDDIDFLTMNVIGIYNSIDGDIIVVFNNSGNAVAVLSGNVIHYLDSREVIEEFLRDNCEQVEAFNSGEYNKIRSYIISLLQYMNVKEG